MFHTAESGVAELWNDLHDTGIFGMDLGTVQVPRVLRHTCLRVEYTGPLALGFACYWIFPTFHPDHLKGLFGSRMEPPGFDEPGMRFRALVDEWKPAAVVSFNGKVYEALTGTSTRGYLSLIRQGTLQAAFRTRLHECVLFQTFPASWRFAGQAPQLRRASLRRILEGIIEINARSPARP